MPQTLIKEQISTIQKATKEALKSKDAALRFLKAAGIVVAPAATKPTIKKK